MGDAQAPPRVQQRQDTSSPDDERQAQELTASIHDDSPQMPSPPPQQQAPQQQQTQQQAPQMPSPQPPQQQQAPQPRYEPQQQQAPPAQAPSYQQSSPSPSTSDISTEEYVEAVIEERWADIEEDIRKVVEWKNRSDQTITALSQQFTDLKDRFDKLHAALIGKIESYDKNILEVGAELKAMEKVFSKVMPSFTENVKQLDDMTRRLKK